MKDRTKALTGVVLPPYEDCRAGAPWKSRRHAMKSWHAWKKWSALEPVPHLGVVLFIQVLLGTAFLRGSESVLANAFCERVSPYVFGEQWWMGAVAPFLAAFVLALIWKQLIIHYYYVRCTPRRRRKKGLEPDREPLCAVL